MCRGQEAGGKVGSENSQVDGAEIKVASWAELTGRAGARGLGHQAEEQVFPPKGFWEP